MKFNIGLFTFWKKLGHYKKIDSQAWVLNNFSLARKLKKLYDPYFMLSAVLKKITKKYIISSPDGKQTRENKFNGVVNII